MSAWQDPLAELVLTPPDVAGAIRDAIAGVHPLAEMGARGRAYVEVEAHRRRDELDGCEAG